MARVQHMTHPDLLNNSVHSLKKDGFNKIAIYLKICRNPSEVDCYCRFIKALWQMMDIKLRIGYFFPAALRTGSGWFC